MRPGKRGRLSPRMYVVAVAVAFAVGGIALLVTKAAMLSDILWT